jgi:DNA-binding transcriptional MocR family regulator
MFCAIQLSKADPTPLYMQLANELAKLIRNGSIPALTKLPTIRTFSRKLKINRDTVVSAYKFLENKGLVVAHVGSGTYVAPQAALKDYEAEVSSNHITCSTTYFPKELFPISICQELMSEALSIEGWDAFVDPLYRSRHLLKQSICTYLRSVGVVTLPLQVRLVSDISEFLLNLFKLSGHSSLIVEAYHDLTHTSFLQSVGYKVYEVPLESDGMSIEVLEKYLKANPGAYIWISSYIQNPTGISYSEEKKEKILSLATKYDCYIIEDGTFSDFSYDFFPLKPLYTTAAASDRIIYYYHFSKLYLPSLSYAFFCLPNALLKQLPDNLPYTLNERFLYYYLESTFLSSIRQKIIQTCYQHFTKVLEALCTSPLLCDIFTDKGGLFFWIAPQQQSVDALVQFFLNHNIILSPGNLFTTHQHTPYIRLSIAALTAYDVEKLIDAITALGTCELCQFST